MTVNYISWKYNFCVILKKVENDFSHFKYLKELNGLRIVCTIDPGTKSMGLVLADFDSESPLVIMNIKRDSSENAGIFTEHVRDFLTKIMKLTGVFTDVLIENQYMKFVQSYRTLTSSADSLTAYFDLLGIKNFTKYPKEWMPKFLEDSPRRASLNLNKENKDAIYELGCMYVPAMSSMGLCDAADAFGMMIYYFKVLKIANSNPKVMIGMQIDYNHHIVQECGIFTDNTELVKKVKDMEIKYEKKVKYKTIEFNDKLNIEDNIRSCTSTSNSVFFTVVRPEINYMNYIYKNYKTLGRINKDTLIYLIFTRLIPNEEFIE